MLMIKVQILTMWQTCQYNYLQLHGMKLTKYIGYPKFNQIDKYIRSRVKLPILRLFHVLSTENQLSTKSCPKLRIEFSLVWLFMTDLETFWHLSHGVCASSAFRWEKSFVLFSWMSFFWDIVKLSSCKMFKTWFSLKKTLGIGKFLV